MRQLSTEGSPLRVTYALLLWFAFYTMGSWLFDTIPGLSSAKNIDENLTELFDKWGDPVHNLDVIRHKQIDDKRIVLFEADDRTGIVVYEETLFDFYRYQTSSLADKTLSTFRLESSPRTDKSYVIVFGNATATKADSYHITIGEFRDEKEIPDQPYTFDVVELKNKNGFSQPTLLLYNGNELVMNELYSG